MEKAEKPKRKTGSRAKKQPAASARSTAPSKPRKARSKSLKTASSAAASATPTPVPSNPSPPAAVPPQAAYSHDDRQTVLLLLAPFAVMALAVAAVQGLSPSDSMRRQLALLPDAHPVMEAAVAPMPLFSVPPMAARMPPPPPAQMRNPPLRETVAATFAATDLAILPPSDTVRVRPAQAPRVGKCIATPAVPAQRAPTGANPPAFGRMLARAARAQTQDLVVYKDVYRRIGFPMGDVPRLYGVCTDVIVRAYRALGIDLQVLVHKARIGTGDTSIDHRRTKTLRRFFERYGESLPVTDYAEEYQPGDIVTYYRASGRTSQMHIAIVSDVIAPSGRPMIVHNRGWGPQLEDALFASNITGHYRYSHVAPDEQASAEPTAASVR